MDAIMDIANVESRVKNGGNFKAVLDDLMNCDFVRRYRARKKKNRESFFQLIDNFTLFHYEFLTDGGTETGDVWTKQTETPELRREEVEKRGGQRNENLLCSPPQSGTDRRKCAWAFLWTALAVMAIVRETDRHKILFANIWPDIANTFPGTVYKMRFLRADSIPFLPKLFVLVFFIVFFVVAAIPLIRYFIPLERRTDGRARFGGVAEMMDAVERSGCAKPSSSFMERTSLPSGP